MSIPDDIEWDKIGPDSLPPVPQNGSMLLPNGHYLFWKFDPAVGCRDYWSDEVGGGVNVWNTALVAESTLLAAIVYEHRLLRLESEHKERAPIAQLVEPGF